MIKYITAVFLFFSFLSFSQNRGFNVNPNTVSNDTVSTSVSKHKAPIDWYRTFGVERDTTYIDTSLTIKKEYAYNYLRRDIFGLMPFANEGQTYNTLQYGLNKKSPFPEIGFDGKHFNYLTDKQIRYYSVPTPLTELYFKTTMEQGQSLDAFLTLNTSERLNFSLAYKGLRSLGKYTNQLSTSSNFRFTSNYNTKNNRYEFKTHIVVQDLYNGENGGIYNNQEFESKSDDYSERNRLQVYFKDANTLLKGYRYFFDHQFRINKNKSDNNIYINHQFNYEQKSFNYSQATLATTLTNTNGTSFSYNRFGESYVSSSLSDTSFYNRMYNQVTAIYENSLIGKFSFFIDDFKYNYYYNSILVIKNNVIPSSLNDRINTIGAKYNYEKNNINGSLSIFNSISKQSLSDIDLNLSYNFNDENTISFQYQKTNKLPNHIYNLFQSSYVTYNWYNNFKNEKINNISISADTKWANAEFNLQTIDDKLYFDATNASSTLYVSPKQYGKTINYLSLKVSKEIVFRHFALDNTILFQKVAQDDQILNVPQIVTRNTLYYSGNVFKKAMFLQTGFTLNYFTKYYANDYNQLIGDFYIQNNTKIGNFPLLDFFVNARVRQTRIYLKAEHFNSLFGKADYYSSPSNPYRDFIVRFGLVWTFFQ